MTHYSARDRSKPTPGHVENQAWTTMPIDGATRESVSAFLMFFESRARADTTSTSKSPGSPSWTMALDVRTHKPTTARYFAYPAECWRTAATPP